MNIDQLITEKTQILRNNRGEIVNAVTVEGVKAAYSIWEKQREGLTTEWLKRGRKIAALELKLNQQNNEIKAQGVEQAAETLCGQSVVDGYEAANFLLAHANQLHQQNKEQ